MPVSLPALIWKRLLGETTEVADLEAIDKLTIQAMDQLQALPKDQFEFLVQETFTTQLSGGVQVRASHRIASLLAGPASTHHSRDACLLAWSRLSSRTTALSCR